MRQLFDFLKEYIIQNLCSEEIGILYSGGLDSSIILKILSQIHSINKIKPVTVGVKKCYDIKNALNGAQEFGIELNICLLDKTIINSTVERMVELNMVSEVEKLAIAIPLFIGMEFLSHNDINVTFLGQGADELFGGYEKYSKLYRESKEEEIAKMMLNDLDSLVSDQQTMEKQIANYFGISLVYPFLSPAVVQFAQSLPITKHIVGDKDHPIRKAVLRKLALDLDLSSNIASQPKKAFQYGSGTAKLLRKVAKDAGYPNLTLWFERISRT